MSLVRRPRVTLLTDPNEPAGQALFEAIDRERRRRAGMIGGYHYWRQRGDDAPPPEEHYCGHCAGWFGVPHPIGEAPHNTHRPGFYCRFARTDTWCACIDCTVARAWRP